MKHYQTAGSIITHDGKVLLVEHKPKNHKHRMWRHNTAAPFWTFPSGKKEAQDFDILATARREAWEEAGVRTKETGQLLYKFFFDDPAEGWSLEGFVFRLEPINGAELSLPADPDDAILSSGYYDRDDACQKITTMKLRPLTEPVLSFLQNGITRTEWHYHLDENAEYQLIDIQAIPSYKIL